MGGGTGLGNEHESGEKLKMWSMQMAFFGGPLPKCGGRQRLAEVSAAMF